MTKHELRMKYRFLRRPTADLQGVYPPRTPYLMFGIECSDGWLPLLDVLFARIEAVIERDGLTDFQVLQVKEKFGSLRVYVDGANKAVHDLIETAGGMSLKVCEKCGQPGSLRTLGGWYLTLCDGDYRAEVNKRRRRREYDDED